MKKKILLTLLIAPLTLIIIAVMIVVVALNWPDIFITPKTLKFAANRLSVFGIHIDWKNAETGSKSYGAFNEALTLKFDDLCISAGDVLEKSCFPKVDVTGRYKFFTIIPKLVALGPVTINGSDIVINVPEGENNEAGAVEGVIKIPEIKLPLFARGAKIGQIDISAGSIKLNSSSPVTIRGAEVHTVLDDNQSSGTINAKADMAFAAGERISASVTASSKSHFVEGDWSLIADAKAFLGNAGSGSLSAELSTNDGSEIEHNIKLSYNRGGLRSDAAVSGIIKKDLFRAKLDGKIDDISEIVDRIIFDGCSLEMRATDRRQNRGDIKFACPINITTKRFDLSEDVDAVYKQPRSHKVDVSVKADTFFVPDLNQRTKAKLEFQLHPSVGGLVKMEGRLSADFNGIFSEPAKNWIIKSDIDLDFKIDEFAKFVKAMGTTDWKIPAPFNVMDGGMVFSLKGAASSETGSAVFPATLSTSLESREQKMFIESKGETSIALDGNEIGNISLDLDVNFDDVQLQLPNLSVARMPQLLPDSRIRLVPPKEETRESGTGEFDYHLTLSTLPAKPIRILSNLTPEFVPISIDLDLKRDDVAGTVAVEEFPVKIFSRTATIDKFELMLREPVGDSAVIGSISVPYMDMTVIIELAGTVDEPVISLASRPPMSQNDILSTLLYGEPMDILDNDNAASVSNMNAAIAEKSIGLTTFLLLGATPIQSISYNPETKLFTASIKLGKETSLLMGSSDTSKELGVRRRLGKGFSIRTGYEKIDESSNGAAAAYLEWSKRY